jgi:hypothetical protein
MGGLLVEYDDHGQPRRERLEPSELYEYIQDGSLSWPQVDDTEIDDRSKADSIVKLLALAQILWFVAQIIGRVAQKLAGTTLELFTLGIVMWAVIIYVVLWEKPYDVRQPILVRVQAKEGFNVRENQFERVEIVGNNIVLSVASSRLCMLICALFSLGFSALHVAAWSFHFSTIAELWLWRANSTSCTVVPLLLALIFRVHFDNESLYKLLFWALVGIYTIGRVYMFGEMFAGLRAAPAGIYQTPQWSQYFPSFG